MKRLFQTVRAFYQQPDPMMLRMWGTLLAAAILLAALIFAGLHAYPEIRFQMQLKRAQLLLDQGRVKEAHQWLGVAARRRLDDPRQLELMVRLAADVHSPYYRYWLLRLYDAKPRDTAIRLKVAQAAILAKDTDEAEQIARGLLADGAVTGEAENILAVAAVQRNAPRETAGAHFARAHELKPDSIPILANYVAFLISAPGRPDAALIESLLQRLEWLPGGKPAALRIRIVLLQRLGRGNEAWELSSGLVGGDSARLEDLQRHLELTTALRPADYPRALQSAIAHALRSPADSTALLEWLLGAQLYADARTLLEKLPPQSRAAMPFCGLEAEMLRRLQRWPELKSLLDSATWNHAAPLRLAYAAEVMDSEKQPGLAEAARARAVLEAPSPEQLYQLLARVDLWPSWKAAKEGLLLRLASAPEWRYAALSGLAALYLEQRSADKLAPVERERCRLRPGSFPDALRAAALSLLQGAELPWTSKLVAQLRRDHPDNALVACLHARLCLVLNRVPEALRTLESIPEPARFSPPFALHAAQIYEAAGMLPQARRALSCMDQTPLLDREQELRDKLTQRLGLPQSLPTP